VRSGSASLKILFLATRDWSHPGTTGGDNTMWENARYLASVGHSVTYVAAGFRGAAKKETVDGVSVVRLGGIHSLWWTSFLFYMRRARGQFDVVIAEGFGGSRIPRFAPLYVKEPILTEWHQIHRDLFAAQYPALLNGPLNLLERVTAWVNRNTLVRAGTEEWREALVRFGFKPENLFVLPVSIREEWLAEPRGRQVRKPNILWLGKLRRYKRPDHAVRAFVKVRERMPEARLTIAGRSDDLAYERQLHELVRDLRIGGSVEFRFDLSEARKRDLIRESRVLVVTSAVEGFGIVVLEANACGVPVVASSGVPEGAVRDGMNGLRYPYGDIAALSSAICKVLEDDQLHARLSQNGREFARGFAWRKIGAQYADVVEHAVALRRTLV
jgi:glycosyltransferase involved in cell wall biosynthesis